MKDALEIRNAHNTIKIRMLFRNQLNAVFTLAKRFLIATPKALATVVAATALISSKELLWESGGSAQSYHLCRGAVPPPATSSKEAVALPNSWHETQKT
jgi:hypothetical protein